MVEEIYAFPSVYYAYREDQRPIVHEGMTLRDYFAAAALTGFCASRAHVRESANFARWAYEQADAMINAGEKK